MRNRRAQTEKKIRVNLDSLIRDVIESKQDNLPQPVLEMTVEDCFAAVEKSRLANVLAHLIDNAQQATEENGTITVSLVNRDGMHVIEIIDNGTGMDHDFIRNRLFKPFDTTKGNAGMGIGMYESREFIRSLGGDIHVQSETGKGTTISLHIPVVVEPPEQASDDA